MSASANAAPAAAATSSLSGAAAAASAVKRPPASVPLSSKDKKAAEEQAQRESAAAAALALIPLSAQPPSSPSQTNVFHFLVQAPPFQLRVNSNALVGVVLEYVREKAIKGVNSMLAARLKRVTEDLKLLHTEEQGFNRRSAVQLAELQTKLSQASKAIEAKQMAAEEAAAAAAAASAQPSADTSAAATATVSPAGPTPVGSSKGRTNSNGTAGPPDLALSSKEKEKEKEKPAKGSKKSREIVVDEPQRSPEEEALLSATTNLQSFQSDHAQRSSLLSREKESLTAEEKQLGLDLQWIKLLHTIGSVVPAPPPPPQQVPAAASRSPTPAVHDTRPSSSVSPDPMLRSPSPPAAAAASASASSASTGAAAPTLPMSPGAQASAKNRKLKSPGSLLSPESAAALAAAAQAQAALIAAASFCPAPSHATFLGIDLVDEQKQPLNLRARPLLSAHTLIKPAASYSLCAVYSQPHAVVTDAAQAALQPNVILVPIQFQQAAQASTVAVNVGATSTVALTK